MMMMKIYNVGDLIQFNLTSKTEEELDNAVGLITAKRFDRVPYSVFEVAYIVYFSKTGYRSIATYQIVGSDTLDFNPIS